MSLYALPGLFPPLDAVAVVDHHQTSRDATTTTRTTGAFCGRELVKITSSSSSCVKEEKEEEKDDVSVMIKEARIDPSRLIQSLTSTATTTAAGKKNAAKQQDRRRPRSSSSIVIEDDVSPQEESMEFELAIEYRGRSYTAMRNLESFLLLRHGLAKEQQEAAQAATQCYYPDDEDSLATNDDSFSSSSPLSLSSSRIPEVPRVLRDECCGVGGGGGSAISGVTGRGFMFLQALLKSYVPLLEEWLRNVLQLQQSMITTSPSLSHFLLWEPVARRSSSPSSRHSSSSFLKLDSIEESDDHDCE